MLSKEKPPGWGVVKWWTVGAPETLQLAEQRLNLALDFEVRLLRFRAERRLGCANHPSEKLELHASQPFST
jgi:hypothetical protein